MGLGPLGSGQPSGELDMVGGIMVWSQLAWAFFTSDNFAQQDWQMGRSPFGRPPVFSFLRRLAIASS